MKLALLVIMFWAEGVTSQIVPADQCEILGKQLAFPLKYKCFYYTTDSKDEQP